MKYKRLVVLMLAALENLIHGGIFFGWPSLVFVLKDAGFYENLCHKNQSHTNTVPAVPSRITVEVGFNQSQSVVTTTLTADDDSCDNQDESLVLVYTVASIILPLSMLPAGYLFQYAGTRIARITFTLVMAGGYVFLALSSPSVPHLLFPGAVSLAVGGIIIVITTMEISNLFPSQKSTVIGIINGCYDTATVIFLMVKIAYENGISLEAASLALAISALFFNINTIILPKDHIPWPLPRNFSLSHPCTTQIRCHSSVPCIKGKAVIAGPACPQLPEKFGPRDMGTQTMAYDNTGFESAELPKDAETAPADDRVPPKLAANDSREVEAERVRDEKYPTLWSCFKSPMFAAIAFWTIVLQVQMLFVLGLMNPWLTWLADGDLAVVSYYTNVLAFMSFLSLAGAPLSGLLLDRKKLKICSNRSSEGSTNDPYGPLTDLYNSWPPVALTTLISIIYTVCMLTRILPLQFLSFSMLTLCRSMLYGVSAGVVPVTFPMRFYAVIYGMIYLLVGVVGFLQYPLFILIQDVLLGNPEYVLIGFITANILTIIYPAYIIYYVRKRAPPRTRIEPGPLV